MMDAEVDLGRVVGVVFGGLDMGTVSRSCVEKYIGDHKRYVPIS